MKITNRQQEVLMAIRKHIERSGRSPTLRELAASINVASIFSVVCLLERLEAKGLISKTGHSARGLLITEDGSEALGIGAEPYTMREWDATMEPDLDRIRATIAALDRLTRRKAVAA